ELLADLVGGAGETGVTGIRDVAAHAGADELGERVDLRLLVGDEQRHVRGARDPFRVAADGGAMLVEDGALARGGLRPAPDVPAIRVLRDDPERDLLAAAPD